MVPDIEFTVRSAVVSPACTVYIQVPVVALVTVNVHVLSVAPVSRVTVTLPVDVTASSNVTVMFIVDPTPYVPFGVVEVTEEMVGAVTSQEPEVSVEVPVSLKVPLLLKCA